MEMQAKETCQQLWQRLALTFKAWTKETANKDELENLMVKEKLLSLLPPSIQSWVRTQTPDTAAKAARLGDEYILSQPKTEPKKWNSNRLEHPKNAGPRPLYRSDPTTKPETPRLPSFDPVKGPCCYDCQDFGHIAAKCPKKTCMVSVATPNPNFVVYPGKINGQKVSSLLVDTACNISQVYPRWLSETYTNQGAVEIQGPNRGKTKYPRTMITLKVEGKTIQLAMAVNSNLRYDAV